MQSNKELAIKRILELIDSLIKREQLNNESVADLGYIKLYLKQIKQGD